MNPYIDHILKDEIHFHCVKSQGPGGQNVNKRNTKVQLFFNIHDSKYLTLEQKKRLISKRKNLIHHEEGVLILSCQEERFQYANKEKVIHHFCQILEDILPKPKERIETNIPIHQIKKRYIDKYRQSQKKNLRKKRKE